MASCIAIAFSFLHVACSARATMSSVPGNEHLQQYTPEPATWLTFQSKPLAVSSITAHDPDSIGWIRSWPKWDGRVVDPTTMTNDAFWRKLCGTGDTVLGIRELFYSVRPFFDNRNPTKAEVDEWHRHAINHLRALVGYNQTERMVQPDHCMFARAQWGQERMHSKRWDSKYPANGQRVYGPCGEGSPSHCGSTFVPDATDQEPYLPKGHPACSTAGGGAEGIFSGPKADIPWSIKWSRAVCNTIKAEGFCGGHVGPWFRREKFGFAFWDIDFFNSNSNAELRGKWTGRLMSNPHCE
jgi:hypothetical protein